MAADYSICRLSRPIAARYGVQTCDSFGMTLRFSKGERDNLFRL